MQSPEGMKILKLLLDEVCETFAVPYLHIGTDEVEFTNPHFVPEMVAYAVSYTHLDVSKRQVPVGAKLDVSYIGYKTQQIVVGVPNIYKVVLILFLQD